jgi:glycosyltransferase involved in cell wall biosynthesis
MQSGPRKILYVNNSADLYGASRCLLRLLAFLDRRQFHPLVLLPEAGPLKDKIEAAGVEVIVDHRISIITRPQLRSWRLLRFLLNFPCRVWWLRRLIRREGIALVHSNTGVIISPGLAARLAGARHVWHVRECFDEFRAVWPAYARYMTFCSDQIIAISEAVARQFPSRKRVTILYDGLTPDEFRVPKAELRQSHRERYGLGNDFVAGCVGRINLHRKGQGVLVQAASLLKKKGRRLKILVVGSPFPGNEWHLQELQRLIHEFQVEDRVVLAGEVADVRGAYAAMDALVLASVGSEGFGLVVTEAMAMGLPVIATRTGGPVDQVVEGETGFLVPPGEPAALAEKIECLQADPDLCSRLGQAGARRVEECFSEPRMVARLQELYGQLLEGTPG